MAELDRTVHATLRDIHTPKYVAGDLDLLATNVCAGADLRTGTPRYWQHSPSQKEYEVHGHSRLVTTPPPCHAVDRYVLAATVRVVGVKVYIQ